jgi:hypothetical protein
MERRRTRSAGVGVERSPRSSGLCGRGVGSHRNASRILGFSRPRARVIEDLAPEPLLARQERPSRRPLPRTRFTLSIAPVVRAVGRTDVARSSTLTTRCAGSPSPGQVGPRSPAHLAALAPNPPSTDAGKFGDRAHRGPAAKTRPLHRSPGDNEVIPFGGARLTISPAQTSWPPCSRPTRRRPKPEPRLARLEGQGRRDGGAPLNDDRRWRTGDRQAHPQEFSNPKSALDV